MPAALERDTRSPRRIIDPEASPYLRSPALLFPLPGLALLLEGLYGASLLLLLPRSSLVAMSRLPSSPPLGSSLIVVSPAVCGKRPQPLGSVSRTAVVRSPAQLPAIRMGRPRLFDVEDFSQRGEYRYEPPVPPDEFP